MEVFVLFVIFSFVVVMTITQNRAKERRDKLRILEEAIRSGNVDPATKQELVAELTGRRPAGEPASGGHGIGDRHGFWSRAAFGIGWLGLFTGVALMLIDQHDTWEAGIVMTGIALAVITLPIAMKELERERPRPDRSPTR